MLRGTKHARPPGCCSAEVAAVFFFLSPVCQNRQAAVNQVTTNTDLKCEQELHNEVCYKLGLQILSAACERLIVMIKKKQKYLLLNQLILSW